MGIFLAVALRRAFRLALISGLATNSEEIVFIHWMWLTLSDCVLHAVFVLCFGDLQSKEDQERIHPSPVSTTAAELTC